MNRFRQQGFTTLAAIFIVVVLAVLGAFMVTFSNTEHLTSASDLQGTRAYRACRAGIEWMGAQLSASHTACPLASTTFTLDGFSVNATCTMHSFDEAGTTANIFWVVSTASAGGAVGSMAYVERSCHGFMEF